MNHPISRRRCALGLFAIAGMAGLSPAAIAADPYPAPGTHITLIVGAGPGGATELVARYVADVLTKRLKAVAVVEFKPGAGGAVGAEFVARARPNGYTLLVASQSGLSVLPHVMKNIKYNVANDFEPVAMIGNSPMVLLAGADTGIKTAQDLIRQIRSSNGGTSYGTSGGGTSLHLAAASFLNEINATATHVPYRGAGAALIGLGGGSTQWMFDIMPTAMAFTKSGKAVPLAVTSATRSATHPDLPTLQEVGVSGYTWGTWLGVAAPAGTPAPLLQLLHRELTLSLQDPQNVERLSKIGLDPVPMERRAFGDFIAQESRRFEAIVKRNQITGE